MPVPSSLSQIKKRNGEVVSFEPNKILLAVAKAYAATRHKENPQITEKISQSVIQQAKQQFTNQTPSVENIQDLVEETLMQEGLFDVAKAYILYRFTHAKIRETKKEEAVQKLERNEFYITKRSGSKEILSLGKIKKTLATVAGNLPDVDLDMLVKQTRLELFEGIKTSDIFKSLILNSRSSIEKDPNYSYLAARLLLNKLYKQVIGEDKIEWSKLEQQYREIFIKNIKEGVNINRLDPKLLMFDLELLATFIKPERDELLNYLGAQTLYDRYLLSNPETKEMLELPQTMWMRVAMGLALNEKNKNAMAHQFYEMISTLRFVPSTPTLFHAGTQHPQLSSCYLNTVEDDLNHIFKVIGDNAQLSKWSGGIGTDWTNLRATGALIKGTGVESQGVIPFLKIANDTTVAINRSGRRRGAACVYLEVWHKDIEDFLELRKNTGDERRRTHDMDTANWIPDLFMQRVRANAEWTLFSPEETPDLHHIYGQKFKERYEHYEKLAAEGTMKLFKKIPALDLWKKMLSMLFETGHPWITFKDPSNIRSPQDHVGVIHNSNLCTEITLNTSKDETAVCNLGSVNLSRHIVNGTLDKEKIAETVKWGIRMLDNVIDINFYPTAEAKNSNLRHRPIGLGVMGWQDALYQMNVNFDSEEAVKLSGEMMENIAYHAYLTSSYLAKERGSYSTFTGSKWDRNILPQDTVAILEKERGEKIPAPFSETLNWQTLRQAIKENGMRNSNCLAIAPTATISNISGCLPSIEPIYKNLYVKSNVSGDFIVINPYLVSDLKKLGLWNESLKEKLKFNDGDIAKIEEIPANLKAKYKEAFDIDPQWLIKAAAARGAWIDQSQSLNLFFIGTSGKAISEIYMYAWEMGLKTTYYLRTLAASQVEKSTVKTQEFGSTHTRKTEESTSAVTPPIMPIPPQPPTQPEIKLCKLNDPTCEACQ